MARQMYYVPPVNGSRNIEYQLTVYSSELSEIYLYAYTEKNEMSEYTHTHVLFHMIANKR